MPRRFTLVAAVVGLAALIVSGLIGVRLFRIMRGDGVVGGAAGRPNIFLLTIDTCRKDHLSVYGYERDTSPELERLAADGFVFDNAFTVASNSAPSHATMLTGLYPLQHGLVDNGLRLPTEIPTLAEFLGLGGYDTAAFIGYSVLGRESQLDQGFETFELHEIDDHAHDTRKLESETRGFAAALEWIEAWRESAVGGDAPRDDPFFVWFHAQQVHAGDPSKPYDTLYADVPGQHEVEGFDDPPFNIRCHRDLSKAWLAGNLTAELQAQAIALYDAEIRLVDDQLEKLFDRLRETGVYDETVIAVLADHGELFFEMPAGDFGRVEPGHTGRYFDPVLRIPLIVKPAKRAGLDTGRRVTQTISSVDLMPTLLELAGYDPLPWMAGRSAVPLMRDPAAESEDHVFFQEIPFEVMFKGMRTSDWKLIVISSEGRDKVALVDLVNDPEETRNVSREHPRQAAEMLKTVRAWVAAQKKTDPSEYADMSDEMREALVRAGYIRETR